MDYGPLFVLCIITIWCFLDSLAEDSQNMKRNPPSLNLFGGWSQSMWTNQMNIGGQFQPDAGNVPSKNVFFLTHFISLCQLSYSHILKIENFPQEWDIFIKEVGIRENITLPWANKSKESSSRKYIQQLTKHEQNQLFQKYKADFLIFGYSVDDEYWFLRGTSKAALDLSSRNKSWHLYTLQPRCRLQTAP